MQMEGAVEVARRMGLPLVCTSDAHYVNREDAEAQDVLLCINTGKFRTDTNRMRMETDQFYLRSPAEMHAAFAGYEEALRQSQTIADSVSIDLDLGKRHFPNYTPPESKSPSDYLRELCIHGLKERYADKPSAGKGPKSKSHVPINDRTNLDLGLGPGSHASSPRRARASRSRARRDQQAWLSQLLPHRLGLRPATRASETSRQPPAARASARWSPTRCT